jgi:hypothetical protein
MKFLKFAFAALATVAFGNAYALHDGGVAHCDACHTMHNSVNGSAAVLGTTPGAAPGPYLLKGSTASDACLNCHEEAVTAGTSTGKTISTPPANLVGTSKLPVTRSPAGDFRWLQVAHGTATTPVSGDQFGHNIIAPDHGYTSADPTKISGKSPGGDYPVASLQCSSCHDPHGTYRITDLANGTTQARGGTIGVAVLPIAASSSTAAKVTAAATLGIGTTAALGTYRLLAGAGYLPKSVATSGATPFAAGAPVIVAPATYAISEATAANEVFVAYGYGTAEWCGNCHSAMHQDANFVSGQKGMVHPAGLTAKLGDLAANYNAYVKSGDLTGTKNASSLVPVEQALASLTALAGMAGQGPTAKALVAPTPDSTVTCLSCHRAHATGFKSMTRFPTLATFFTDGNAGGTGVAYLNASSSLAYLTAEGVQAALYDRPAANFGVYARSLCNKCHAKD